MGIRPIGGKRSSKIGVSEPTRSITIGSQQFTPVVDGINTEQHEPDTIDNGQQQNADGAVDPASVASSGDNGNSSGTGTSGKRRGRKPGSRNRTSGDNPASTQKAANSIASWVCMIHGVAANIVKIPQLAISVSQAEELTKAALEVAELYDVPMPSEKAMAWAHLGSVAYKVYIVGEKPQPKVVVMERQDYVEPAPNLVF